MLHTSLLSILIWLPIAGGALVLSGGCVPGSVIPYQPIVEALRADIVQGRLKPGERVAVYGLLAERAAVDMDRAFQLLRAHARRSNRRLADVARAAGLTVGFGHGRAGG